MGDRVCVVAVDSRNRARLVRPSRGGGWTRWPLLARGSGLRLSEKDRRAAVVWARSRGFGVRQHPSRFPFVELGEGVVAPGDELMHKLSDLGEGMHRLVHVVSGDRTPYQAWVLRQRYLDGDGALAALCCLRFTGKHGWDSCGREPQSNHASGRAADCGLVLEMGYKSMGLCGRQVRDRMRALGLCLPVGAGEVWHVEVGSTWRS